MPNNTINIEEILIKLSDNKTLVLKRLNNSTNLKLLIKELTQHKMCVQKVKIVNGFREQITIKGPEDIGDDEIDEADNYTYDTTPSFILDNDILLELKANANILRVTFNDKRLYNYTNRVFIKTTNSHKVTPLEDFLALLTMTFNWNTSMNGKELFICEKPPIYTHIEYDSLGVHIRFA